MVTIKGLKDIGYIGYIEYYIQGLLTMLNDEIYKTEIQSLSDVDVEFKQKIVEDVGVVDNTEPIEPAFENADLDDFDFDDFDLGVTDGDGDGGEGRRDGERGDLADGAGAAAVLSKLPQVVTEQQVISDDDDDGVDEILRW